MTLENKCACLIAIMAVFCRPIAAAQLRNAWTEPSLQSTPKRLAEPQEKPLEKPEVMPVNDGLQQFLIKHLQYPEEAMENGQEGRTIVGFIVRTDGYVSDVKIKGSSGISSLDSEAVRVIRLMEAKPYWKPGKQKGADVDVIFNLPITFSLGGRRGRRNAHQ